MRYLIDTNVFINYIEDKYITDDVRVIISNYENIIYISSESVKEYIHLVQNDKVTPNISLRKLDVFDFIENTLGFHVKFIAKEHLRTLTVLDTIDGHNDPNDRLIIAQAITEKIPLISSDKKFPKYLKMGLEFSPNYY